MSKLFEKRDYYKPFDFPWAFEAFKISEQMHWLPQEVPLNQDIKDWKTTLTKPEKNLLTQIFRFFTQADVDIASGYIDRFLPVFKAPELRMMLTSIAAREAIHMQAYSMLIDELGLPEVEYRAFLEYKEMREKHEYLLRSGQELGEHPESVALNLALYSVFGEGLQLFASFVILLNFPRFGKLIGMGQIVSWSIRDETHHVESMIQLYREVIHQYPEIVTPAFSDKIDAIAWNMVNLEFKFIELAFSLGSAGGISAEEIKKYVTYICDVRLTQIGQNPLFGVEKNPLPWVDILVFGKEHVNFFENKATDYSKGTLTGDWGDAFE